MHTLKRIFTLRRPPSADMTMCITYVFLVFFTCSLSASPPPLLRINEKQSTVPVLDTTGGIIPYNINILPLWLQIHTSLPGCAKSTYPLTPLAEHYLLLEAKYQQFTDHFLTVKKFIWHPSHFPPLIRLHLNHISRFINFIITVNCSLLVD